MGKGSLRVSHSSLLGKRQAVDLFTTSVLLRLLQLDTLFEKFPEESLSPPYCALISREALPYERIPK